MLPYIAYNMSCLTIYLMLIPLTPPDDEVGIGIPYSVIIYVGYIYYNINIMAHLPFLVFDYVNLMTMSTYYSKLCLL